MKIAVIDNYDSFTYNLVHLIKELDEEVDVLRNDTFKLEELSPYDKLVFSPGPGIPKEAGLLEEVIRFYKDKKPMLGVCLGEQAIAEVFGARLENLPQVFHGKQTPVRLLNNGSLFRHLPEQISVGRYHSWIVSTKDFPDCLEITALSPEGYIMALNHKDYPIYGIQFHPESILTPDGKQIMQNFLHA